MDASKLVLPDLSEVRFDLGGDLTLRQFKAADAEPVLDVIKRNETHLMEFMHWMTPDYSLATSLEFIERAQAGAERRETVGFGIFRDIRPIGSIGYVFFDTKAAKTEIGYWIDRNEQGKGIVSTATRLLIDFAFTTLGMNRIEIRCSAENVRSAAIPRRFGFKEEGRLRQAEMRNGKLHDFLLFGLLRSEWKG